MVNLQHFWRVLVRVELASNLLLCYQTLHRNWLILIIIGYVIAYVIAYVIILCLLRGQGDSHWFPTGEICSDSIQSPLDFGHWMLSVGKWTSIDTTDWINYHVAHKLTFSFSRVKSLELAYNNFYNNRDWHTSWSLLYPRITLHLNIHLKNHPDEQGVFLKLGAA